MSNLPIVLCFHGGGTSAAIFNAQLRNVRISLKNDFELVYVNAPHEGPAGPGVLPLFADSGPFYWWFKAVPQKMGSSNPTKAINDRMFELSNSVDACIDKALEDAGRTRKDVVGVLGFSEGTMVASLMLAQCSRQYESATGRRRPLPNLTFGVLLCAGYRTDIAMILAHYPVRLPTVHLHGSSDPLLPSSRALLKAYAAPDLAQHMEFKGGHHIPSEKKSLEQVISMVKDAYMSGMQLKMGMAPSSRSSSPVPGELRSRSSSPVAGELRGRAGGPMQFRRQLSSAAVSRSSSPAPGEMRAPSFRMPVTSAA